MSNLRVVLALFVCVACKADLRAEEPDHNKLLRAFEKKFQETAAAAAPSIACVVVSRSEFYPETPGADATPGKLGDFDPKEFLKEDSAPKRAELASKLDLANPRNISAHGFAGGVVIDDAGYVLTPYHVIDGAKRVYVFFTNTEGSYADIHAADARSDLAVLRLIKPPAKLKAIPYADVRTHGTRGAPPTVKRGKLVFLMTNTYSTTFGVGPPSAAFGSITSVRTRIPPRGSSSQKRRATEYGALLEYDVKPNAGVSGGALLNLDGQLMGMTNAAAVAYGREIGPGYAMPADEHFQRIVGVLRRGEEVEYGFLGVETNAAISRPGSPVVRPTPGGSAESAGIREGDVIVGIGGTPVDSFDDLQLQVGSALAGSRVEVTVSRGGRELDLSVKLAKFNNDQPFLASSRPEPVFGLRVDYGSILTQQFKDRRLPGGVCVREVLADSPAAKQFQSLGDTTTTSWLITSVNDLAVSTPAEFYKHAKGQEKLKLTLYNASSRRQGEMILP